MVRRLVRAAGRHAWLRITLTVLGLIALCAAIWFGGPMTGVALLGTVWLRATVIGTILGIVLLIVGIKWWRRRKAAKALEDALVEEREVGDGKILSERMTQALATLKKSGGSTYLYDLPWYVIIGPPGAGKTTALANSGIEFPLSKTGEAVEGFGGTRNCDWWFAEDAILIDTAGRYTTQDSNAEADGASWTAFLNLLKRTRPKQPINGVILAFSVEDMMTADADQRRRHAETVRARLAEVHETLKIDFPVYVLFTKADLISGFREYFGSFSQSRRNAVWGATFQTKDRKALTHESVPQEFDALLSRLSEEVIDRLNEEPDGISRVAIFGLPGQMAMLREGIGDFLRRVFEPTRYKSNAILRGFYFTSGTQEGTPIDQVLGAMSREGAGTFGGGFMSGRGKSYFLRDLLEKVIFAEQDWVSHDRRAVRRDAIVRGVGFATVAIATLGAVGALGYSYWRNATLVSVARAETAAYARAAQGEADRTVITDTSLEPVLPLLQDLAFVPAGYAVDEEPTFWEGIGLGQWDRLEAASAESYSDALERMLRPRLILALEQEIPLIIARGETTEIYRALKIYLLLGGQGAVTDDAAIVTYFRERWGRAYEGLSGLETQRQLQAHLEAMLAMDDDRPLLLTIDDQTVQNARQAIAQLSPAEQAWAIIQDGVAGTGLPDWDLVEAAGNSAERVFATRDGSDLSTQSVDALYTYEGFWGYFYPALSTSAERLRADQWVLGENGVGEEFEARMRTLDRSLLDRYRREHRDAWMAVLGNLSLNSLVADAPRYEALGLLAGEMVSPLLNLVKSVATETRLTTELENVAGLSPEQLASAAAGGSVGSEVGNEVASRALTRTRGVTRMLAEIVMRRQGTGGVGGGGASAEGGIMAPIERIEEEFSGWHALLDGQAGQRPIDAVLGNLGSIWTALNASQSNPEQAAVLLPQLLNELTRYNSQLPQPVAALVNEAEADFRQGATDANIETMNRALQNQIAFKCRETITAAYPFANSQRNLGMADFSSFFGPGGDMDRFFSEYLAPYVERTSEGLRYRADSPLAGRLSPGALRQFERAERIRQAFFQGGSNQPAVEITIQQVDNHSTVESALLVINDQEVETVRYEIPKTVTWPGPGKATALVLRPSLDRPSTLGFTGSAWTFMKFLDAASAKQQRGDVLRATFMVGGRNITYDFTINAVTNPFTMRELREFECPQSLD
ncbi:type VI secretion system membrane subunit TssM [Jannaschia aquimarina]|uniref:Type VI secretion system membrane subunit TssM n=1 Tax=Jannaschia aquimarina TaxID=935700 RepID=A0A0D1EGR4_9RHOB|nr:type VI secretion system membrane subunit TssM [Jannaschia aquimarina]KIT16799.1 hypothetical protein jaqu_14500 [Jannaschia aquimarina]SNT23683.1 type VI secretion system protein ImpL [Jannaschia aquimarina]